jgi:hypothetical protein
MLLLTDPLAGAKTAQNAASRIWGICSLLAPVVEFPGSLLTQNMNHRL